MLRLSPDCITCLGSCGEQKAPTGNVSRWGLVLVVVGLHVVRNFGGHVGVRVGVPFAQVADESERYVVLAS